MSKVAVGRVMTSDQREIESRTDNLEELLVDKVQATEEWFGVHKLLVATMTTRRTVPEFALPMNTEVEISDTDRWPKVILLVRMVSDEINRCGYDEEEIEEIYTWLCKFAIYKGRDAHLETIRAEYQELLKRLDKQTEDPTERSMIAIGEEQLRPVMRLKRVNRVWMYGLEEVEKQERRDRLHTS